jgi:preprotein translocase subunit SecA
MFLELKKRIRMAVVSTLIELIRREGPVDLEKEGLRGPSSTWTYLVNDDQAEWGVELLKGRNIGFAAGAGSPLVAPFLALALLAKRSARSRKKKKVKTPE